MCDRGPVLLERLRVCQQQAARLAAEQLDILAEFARLDCAEADFTPLEVAAVAGFGRRYAQRRLDLAETLTTRLPKTLQALRDGAISAYTSERMAAATEVLSDAHAALVEDQLIPRAGEWTPEQLNPRLRRAVIKVDPDAATARAEAQRAARRVRHETLDDGAGLLQIQGDVERTQLAYNRVKAVARQIKSSGDTRTLDQITADVALDCLAGKDFTQAKIHVWLTIPATTALGVDDKPGHLAGYGWLPAQRALDLAAQTDATWQRVLTDPATGHVLDVGRHHYRPPAALRDHLRAQFPTCTGPGCHKPAHLCDQDHLIPFPAGPTTPENLRPLCRPHHRAKTHGGWTVTSTDNQPVWITKHGFRFPYEPEPIAEPVTG